MYTIRSPKDRPDDKSKDQYCGWYKLPSPGELNPA